MSSEPLVIVTGASGFLGAALLRSAPRGLRIVGLRRADADLSSPAAVARTIAEARPWGVIHAAGFTDVDRAERDPDGAARDNTLATAHVAAACARAGARLLFLSTDYVFDGGAGRPYHEDDEPRPLGVYARSKRLAELAALRAHDDVRVVRTSWLFGPWGRHFPARVVARVRETGRAEVVAGQTGSPTSVVDLAPALYDVLREAPPGIWHAACDGTATRLEWARAALECAGLPPDAAVPASDVPPDGAPRPAFSALDSSKLAALRGRPLPHWRDALARDFAAAAG